MVQEYSTLLLPPGHADRKHGRLSVIANKFLKPLANSMGMDVTRRVKGGRSLYLADPHAPNFDRSVIQGIEDNIFGRNLSAKFQTQRNGKGWCLKVTVEPTIDRLIPGIPKGKNTGLNTEIYSVLEDLPEIVVNQIASYASAESTTAEQFIERIKKFSTNHAGDQFNDFLHALEIKESPYRDVGNPDVFNGAVKGSEPVSVQPARSKWTDVPLVSRSKDRVLAAE